MKQCRAATTVLNTVQTILFGAKPKIKEQMIQKRVLGAHRLEEPLARQLTTW